MDVEDVVRRSVTARYIERVSEWASHSTLGPYILSERLQFLVLVLVLLSSFHSITGSDLSTVAKFLSFVLLFLLTTIATWSLTDPRGTRESQP